MKRYQEWVERIFFTLYWLICRIELRLKLGYPPKRGYFFFHAKNDSIANSRYWKDFCCNAAMFGLSLKIKTMYMRYGILSLMFCFILNYSNAQTYTEKIQIHRDKYISDFLTDEHSPLSKKDIKHLDFYEIDSAYSVKGNISLTPDAIPFDMATSLGIVKRYVQYAIITFQLHDSTFTLSIYQSMKLREQEEYKDYLFVPFNDNTNYTETYGGGRYLDFRMRDIVDGNINVDFNKVYNPYCAYSGGYACPVPPAENKLNTDIKAGEKNFKKK